MKKNQNKSKFEECKSVANQCDYSRSNGKCGRAMCDNFGKLCPGRSCEDWSCDAEGTAVTVVEAKSQQMAANSYQARVSEAYTRIETAKDNLLRECVKFGALLLEVSYYLGETRGGKHENGGLHAWLSENCPQINYKTAMGYKRLGEMAVTKLGGGSQAVAVLQDKTEVVPPGENEPIEVDSKFLEKRDELFNEVKSRRDLEQTYFKFMASEGRRGPGRPKGTTKPVPENYAAAHKTNAENAATAYAILWRELDKKRQLPNLASLLSIEDARSIHELIKPVFEALRKRVGEAE